MLRGQHGGQEIFECNRTGNRNAGGKRMHSQHKLGMHLPEGHGGKRVCEHKLQKSECTYCEEIALCEHSTVRSECKDCEWASIYKHNQQRIQWEASPAEGLKRQFLRLGKNPLSLAVYLGNKVRSPTLACRLCLGNKTFFETKKPFLFSREGIT